MVKEKRIVSKLLDAYPECFRTNMAARLGNHRYDVMIGALFELWTYAMLRELGLSPDVVPTKDEGGVRTPDFAIDVPEGSWDVEAAAIIDPRLLNTTEIDLRDKIASIDHRGWLVSWRGRGNLKQSVKLAVLSSRLHQFIADEPVIGSVKTIYQNEDYNLEVKFCAFDQNAKGGSISALGEARIVRGPERIQNTLRSKYSQRRDGRPYIVAVNFDDSLVGDIEDVYTALFGNPDMLELTVNETGDVVDQKQAWLPGGFWNTKHNNADHKGVHAVIFVDSLIKGQFAPDIRMIMNPYLEADATVPAALRQLPTYQPNADNRCELSEGIATADLMTRFLAEGGKLR